MVPISLVYNYKLASQQDFIYKYQGNGDHSFLIIQTPGGIIKMSLLLQKWSKWMVQIFWPQIGDYIILNLDFANSW